MNDYRANVQDVLSSAKLVELWAGLIAVGWGFQMIIAPHLRGYDIIGAYLTGFLPLPLPEIGIIVLLTGLFQIWGLLVGVRFARMAALLGEFVFFLFCWLALVKGQSILPGVLVLPSYFLVLGVRHVWLSKHKTE